MLFLRSKSFRKKRLAWNCLDYVILLYYWLVQGASSLSHFFLLCRFHLRRTFVNSIKLPVMILSWKNLQEVFLMLVIVVVLPHWKFLRAQATFLCYQHSTLASQTHEGLHQLWTLPWLLSIALRLPAFSITALPRALRFWVGAFYLQSFFTLHSLPTFCHDFVTQILAGTPHPGSSSDLPSQSWPSRLKTEGWSWTTHIVDTRSLVSQLCQCVTK